MVDRIDPSSASTRVSEVEREREREVVRRAVDRRTEQSPDKSSDRVEISNGNYQPDKVESASPAPKPDSVDNASQELAGREWYRYGLPSAYEEMES